MARGGHIYTPSAAAEAVSSSLCSEDLSKGDVSGEHCAEAGHGYSGAHSRSTSPSWGLRDLHTGSRAQGWRKQSGQGKSVCKGSGQEKGHMESWEATSSVTRGLERETRREFARTGLGAHTPVSILVLASPQVI